MIRMVEDVAAPAAVAAADIITLEVAPDWNEWASYIIAAGGYVGGFMGFGGPFVKNLGVASFDWAARNLYQRIKGTAVTTRVAKSRAVFKPASVGRSYQPEFEATAPHAF